MTTQANNDATPQGAANDAGPSTAANESTAANTPARRAARETLVVQDSGQFAALMDTGRFEHLWRVAKVFAMSDMVPAQYRDRPENCLLSLQMAMRLDIDPMMMMQNTYVTSGKPGMEGKLAIALINARGPFRGSLQFEYTGSPGADDFGCRAWGIHRETGERVNGPLVTIAVAKAEGWYGRNPKWKSIPELMLAYRAGAWLGRLYCPEALLGMQTREELEDIGQASIADDAAPGAASSPPQLTLSDVTPRAARGRTAPAATSAEEMETTPAEQEPRIIDGTRPGADVLFDFEAEAARLQTLRGRVKPGDPRSTIKRCAAEYLDEVAGEITGGLLAWSDLKGGADLDALARVRARIEADRARTREAESRAQPC